TLFIANLLGIPLSTSEVTVGAIVGVGMAYKALFINHILLIIACWVVFPLFAFLIALVLGKGIGRLEHRYPMLRSDGSWKKWLAMLVIATGFVEAFSAGMNNVANAIGPLVGA